MPESSNKIIQYEIVSEYPDDQNNTNLPIFGDDVALTKTENVDDGLVNLDELVKFTNKKWINLTRLL